MYRIPIGERRPFAPYPLEFTQRGRNFRKGELGKGVGIRYAK